MKTPQRSEQSQRYRVIGTRPIRHDGEDKVTGRALYGADIQFKDQLHGKVLRSPHAHARIVSLDVSAALALPGVRAVTTAADLPRLEERMIESGEGVENVKYMTDRVLASGKVLFKGHPVAAVAADDPWTAEEACQRIQVRYEPLPPVLDVLEAMEGKVLLHDAITTTSLGKKSKQATNICLHTQFKRGDVEQAFREADLVVEREFRSKTVHQGYIESHNATALARADGQITVWTSTQGHFPVREQLSIILKLPLSRIKVVPMEIGGGFGGKISVYLEPLAVLLSQKTGRPVKMTMTRAEVFQATGPAGASVTRIKVGVKKDGTLTGLKAWLAYETGAFPAAWGATGAQCVFAPYRTRNLLVDSYDVLMTTPKVAAYRAPGSPQAMWGVESIMDEIAQRLNLDPLEFRLKNAVEEGDLQVEGLPYPRIGLKETIRAVLAGDHYRSPAPTQPYHARGVALGFWKNNGMQSSALVAINMDGTASVTTGSPDIGGSRASMAMIAAETLGLTAQDVRPTVGDTEAIGHTDVTAGSRVTFATGYAVHEACQDALRQMDGRVAKLWDCQPADVSFREGAFHHAGGKQPPLTVKQLAPKLTRTGGPVLGRASVLLNSWGAGFGCHVADIAVDPDTGKVTILRYTAAQDVGTAIHPAYVEGQLQGGATQGIGWALNEEYVHNAQGELLNAGFLDYRMPTFVDVPDIETILVEVPHPGHPYGVRGVGETPIVPPIGTLHNAIARATGARVRELPMSPPRVLAAMQAQAQPIAAD
jgi:CO/xanthine dehydrogenase Mo-binding subunit